MLRYTLGLLMLLGGVQMAVAEGVADGQSPVQLLGARFEPSQVLIGDHFELVLEVEAEEGNEVAFPTITPDFTEGRIELLEERGVDTLESGGGRYRLRKSYRLTSFEPAHYSLDSVGVLWSDGVKIDTLFASGALEVEVAAMPIDTAQKTIHDIRQPLEAPILLGEFQGYLLTILLAIAVVVSVVWLVVTRIRIRRGAKPEAELPKVAPHIAAIRSLERLHNQKLWQNGRYKEYYSRLTEILREYLDGRFGIGAMEMTTDEIVAALAKIEITTAQRSGLTELLRESDLVKFAKHTPTEDTHESAYNLVYYFVEESKEVAEEVVAAEKQVPEGVTPTETVAEEAQKSDE